MQFLISEIIILYYFHKENNVDACKGFSDLLSVRLHFLPLMLLKVRGVAIK
jgi:hypothetical protein